MKKVILSFVAIAALTVVSCKKDAENADATTDTTVVETETTTVDTVATTVDTTKVDTVATETTTEVKK